MALAQGVFPLVKLPKGFVAKVGHTKKREIKLRLKKFIFPLYILHVQNAAVECFFVLEINVVSIKFRQVAGTYGASRRGRDSVMFPETVVPNNGNHRFSA